MIVMHPSFLQSFSQFPEDMTISMPIIHVNADQQNSDIESSLTESIARDKNSLRCSTQELVKGVSSHVTS